MHSFGSADHFTRANNVSFNDNRPTLLRNQESWQTHARIRSSMELNFIKHQGKERVDQENKSQKRKISELNCQDVDDVDLSLSLKLVTPKNGQPKEQVGDDDEVNTSNLSLSLFSPSTSNCTSRLLEKNDRSTGGGKKHARTMASTLDLTL